MSEVRLAFAMREQNTSEYHREIQEAGICTGAAEGRKGHKHRADRRGRLNTHHRWAGNRVLVRRPPPSVSAIKLPAATRRQTNNPNSGDSEWPISSIKRCQRINPSRKRQRGSEWRRSKEDASDNIHRDRLYSRARFTQCSVTAL